MGELSTHGGGPPSRRERERRAYRLVQVGGVSATVAVVGAMLAIFGAIGFGLPLIAAIVAAICLVLFRRTVSR